MADDVQTTDGSSSAAADDLEKASLDTVYEKLGTSAKGLTAAEAKARIEKYGRNELVDKEASDLEKFLRFFWGPIAWMIEAAALLSLLMGHWADLTIILVLLFYNAISGFWQERKASNARYAAIGDGYSRATISHFRSPSIESMPGPAPAVYSSRPAHEHAGCLSASVHSAVAVVPLRSLLYTR